jgi:hypothetical protein
MNRREKRAAAAAKAKREPVRVSGTSALDAATANRPGTRRTTARAKYRGGQSVTEDTAIRFHEVETAGGEEPEGS